MSLLLLSLFINHLSRDKAETPQQEEVGEQRHSRACLFVCAPAVEEIVKYIDG